MAVIQKASFKYVLPAELNTDKSYFLIQALEKRTYVQSRSNVLKESSYE